jgi:tetratricopeptide (TPR) repeat protein
MADETRDARAKQAETLFSKGFATFERGNYDLAIDLLLRAVELAPGHLRARRFLRAAMIQRLKKAPPPSGLMGKIRELTYLPAHSKASLLFQSGKLDRALLEAEKLLRLNPVHFRSVALYADIAVAAGQMEAAVLTLEAAAEYDPKNMNLVLRIGHAYMKAEDYAKARSCYLKVLAERPADAACLRLLKDAEAQHSIKTGGYDESGPEEGKSLEKRLVNQEQTRLSAIQAKAQTTESDADLLIAEWRRKLAVEPGNLNYYRALARELVRLKRFAEAIDALTQARQRVASDPELDRLLADIRVREYTARIEECRARPDLAAAEALEQEKRKFVFDDLVARVEKYPNDLRLRYELGVQYFQQERYDDAIQQLQLAQRSAKERTDAVYYLARAFRAKGQNDIALMQLETAKELLPQMDENRKKVLFELGEVYEATGSTEKAFACYREVYSADIAYQDIGQKMERCFKQRQQQGG